MNEDSRWNSRKLVFAVLAELVAGVMGLIGALTGLYLCVALVVPTVAYIWGQAAVDAIKAFAIAKFAKPPV